MSHAGIEALKTIIIFVESGKAVIKIQEELVETLKKEQYTDIEKHSSLSFHQKNQMHRAKENIKSIEKNAVCFVHSIDDLLICCMNTNFSEIKECLAQNDLNPLQKFMNSMDEYLNKIVMEHESFHAECQTGIRECIAAAEECNKLQALQKKKKNTSKATSRAGVTPSAALIIAGIFPLGIGTAIARPLLAGSSAGSVTGSATAGVITVGSATAGVIRVASGCFNKFAVAESMFRSYSKKLTSATSLAMDMKEKVDRVHKEVKRFENSRRPLLYLDSHSYSSLCEVLDKLYEVSSPHRSATEKQSISS